MKKLNFFSSNFKKFQDVVYYRKLKMSNFVILKWRPFEYKIKSRKIRPFLGLFFSEIKNAYILNFMNQIFR